MHASAFRILTCHSLLQLFLAIHSRAAEVTIRNLQESSAPSHATIPVHAAQRSPHPIPADITGKFAEHLGANIYNGMDAQILRNPTFADYPFSTGQMSPDGVAKFHSDDSRIVEELRRQALRWGWPESQLEGLVHARADGLACFWTRTHWDGFSTAQPSPPGRGQGEGQLSSAALRTNIQVSPDTGPYGGRAQRIQ